MRAATTFGVEEHLRSTMVQDALARRDVDAIGRAMAASHAGYDAMGLGHPAATAAVDAGARPPRRPRRPVQRRRIAAAPWSSCANGVPSTTSPISFAEHSVTFG